MAQVAERTTAEYSASVQMSTIGSLRYEFVEDERMMEGSSNRPAIAADVLSLTRMVTRTDETSIGEKKKL